jgi:hypothetical protein
MVALWGAMLSAVVGLSQTVVHGTIQDEAGIPSIIHVKRVDYPALQLGTWQGEILVNDSGAFDWHLPLDEPQGLYELVAPPWSWMVWVREGEQSTLHLQAGNATARRLMGSPGQSRWEGTHPTHWMDSLVAFQNRANRLRAEALVLRSSGVDLGNRDSLRALSAELDAAFDRRWNQAIAECQGEWECDLAWQIKLNEAASSGRSARHLDSLWRASSMAQPYRTWESRLYSPGAYAGWRTAYGSWWQGSDVDWNKLREALFSAELDSLAAGMGGRWRDAGRDEMAAAWLDKAMDAPDAFVRSVWETFRFPDAFIAAYEALRSERRIGRRGWEVGDLAWTLPNGELGSVREQCMQPWTVVLALKNGSGLAVREREMFSQLAEDFNRRDVCWVVLSLDDSEANWRQTLSGRRTLDETVGWVGNNPRVMESLGLVVVPQVVLLDEDGKIAETNMPLPSAGLKRKLIELLPRE